MTENIIKFAGAVSWMDLEKSTRLSDGHVERAILRPGELVMDVVAFGERASVHLNKVGDVFEGSYRFERGGSEGKVQLQLTFQSAGTVCILGDWGDPLTIWSGQLDVISEF